MSRSRSSSYLSPLLGVTSSPRHHSHLGTPAPTAFQLPNHVIPSTPFKVSAQLPSQARETQSYQHRHSRRRASSQSILPTSSCWPVEAPHAIYPPQPRSAMRRTVGYDELPLATHDITPRSSTARMPMNLPNQAAVLHIGTAGGLSSPHKQTQRPQHSRRQRRHSSNGVTFAPKPQYIQEGWVLRAYPTVAFSMKGAIQVSGGVSVTEALGLGSATKPNATKMRLSLNEHYSPNFFHPNEEGRVTVRLAWDRYGSQDYHISLDASSGRVNLNKFVRHIARGCEEFVTRFRIPVHLDRLRLHYIEETSRGIWSLKLSVAPL